MPSEPSCLRYKNVPCPAYRHCIYYPSVIQFITISEISDGLSWYESSSLVLLQNTLKGPKHGPSTHEAEAGRYLCVGGQPDLHTEFEDSQSCITKISCLKRPKEEEKKTILFQYLVIIVRVYYCYYCWSLTVVGGLRIAKEYIRLRSYAKTKSVYSAETTSMPGPPFIQNDYSKRSIEAPFKHS